jgi:Zn-dependent M28 family amino/carboxypeptidase
MFAMTKIRVAAALVFTLAPGIQRAPVAQGPAIDRAQLMRDVETLSADGMEGRRAGTPGAARARAYIVDRLVQAGVRPAGQTFEQPFTFTTSAEAGPREGVNVLGVIRGRRAPERYIAITAHYDHLGVRNGQVYNGADDNASGVAALLALAAHFAKAGTRHSLLIAALDAEESGLRGATALLEQGPVARERIALNVNLDMLGRDAGNVLYVAGTYHYPFLKPYLEGTAHPPVQLRFGHDVPNVKEEDWTKDSDHHRFHEAGIPFVYFGVEDFEQHHKATDDADTIQPEFFAGVVQTIVSAVGRFDENLEAIRDRR